ncbi:hypothetical protein [Mycolicibacterium tusciae]|uniref:hypothetical protein n=1 Tax=Mycolicibacterium tusciae TaxID=75922 RepID=UPI00024A2D6E|nr:hypothetical protein [Mycolicibacterium tusciae]
MNGEHSDIGPELRQLAQTILDRLDPMVRMVAARAATGEATPGKCQQVWCPVCALAALAAGEEHPLLAVIADHSVALLTVVRTIVEDTADAARSADAAAPPAPPPDGSQPPPDLPDGDGPAPSGPGSYQHIPVTVEE